MYNVIEAVIVSALFSVHCAGHVLHRVNIINLFYYENRMLCQELPRDDDDVDVDDNDGSGDGDDDDVDDNDGGGVGDDDDDNDDDNDGGCGDDDNDDNKDVETEAGI